MVEITYSQDGKAVISFSGRIYKENVKDLREKLTTMYSPNVHYYTLDFFRLKAITSFGLKEIVRFEQDVIKKGGNVEIVNSSELVVKLVDIAHKILVS